MQSARDILNQRTEGEEIPANVKEMALSEAEQIIKNYCNRPFVPWQLNFAWAGIAHDIVQARYIQKKADGIPDNEVASIRAGDMTISRGAEFISHRINLDEITKIYASELNPYRRFRWGLYNDIV